MTLNDLRGVHQGQEAWLAGKGPSLSKFDWSQAGKLRAGINSAVELVPEPVYHFCWDGKLGDYNTHGSTLLGRTERNGKEWSFDFKFDGNVQRAIEQGIVFFKKVSATFACSILSIMGVRHIHLIGIDGGGPQWREWQDADPRPSRNQSKIYEIGKQKIIECLNAYGVSYTDYSLCH